MELKIPQLYTNRPAYEFPLGMPNKREEKSKNSYEHIIIL
jgi:hypothetical protein